MRDATGNGRSRPVALSMLTAVVLAAAVALATGAEAVAQTNAQRLKLLEQTVKELLERDEARERKMKAMEAELKRLRRSRGLGTVMSREKPASEDGDSDGHGHGKKPATAAKPDGHGHGHGHGDEAGEDSAEEDGHEPTGVWSARIGDGILRLSRIGLDADFAAGTSSATDEEMESLFGGHHDPKRTGFTLQSADLSMAGSYDPYFDAFFNLTFSVNEGGETGVEIEEAWVRSKWVADESFRVKAGHFFTAFGAVNPTHLHDWAWQTQPVIATRVFGADGARGLGLETEARLSDAPWRSSLFLSMQNRRSVHVHGHGDEEGDHGAEEENHGDEEEEESLEANSDRLDDFVFLFRLQNQLKLSPRTSFAFGGSAMFEPNPNGNGTPVSIFGADLKVSHRLPSNDRLDLAAEFMHRNSKAAVEEEHGAEEEEEEEEEHHAEELLRLQDFGFYVQGMWYMPDGWGFGLRYEYAASRGGDADGRAADPMRGKRTRISPLLLWQFSELGRLKLQYNYDRADFLEDRIAHSLFLSASWSLGLGAPDHAGHAH